MLDHDPNEREAWWLLLRDQALCVATAMAADAAAAAASAPPMRARAGSKAQARPHAPKAARKGDFDIWDDEDSMEHAEEDKKEDFSRQTVEQRVDAEILDYRSVCDDIYAHCHSSAYVFHRASNKLHNMKRWILCFGGTIIATGSRFFFACRKSCCV